MTFYINTYKKGSNNLRQRKFLQGIQDNIQRTYLIRIKPQSGLEGLTNYEKAGRLMSFICFVYPTFLPLFRTSKVQIKCQKVGKNLYRKRIYFIRLRDNFQRTYEDEAKD